MEWPLQVREFTAIRHEHGLTANNFSGYTRASLVVSYILFPLVAVGAWVPEPLAHSFFCPLLAGCPSKQDSSISENKALMLNPGHHKVDTPRPSCDARLFTRVCVVC